MASSISAGSTAVAPANKNEISLNGSMKNLELADDDTIMYAQIRSEALDALRAEPELSVLFEKTVLAPNVTTLEDAVATTVCHRLLLNTSQQQDISYENLLSVFQRAFQDDEYTELGHTIRDAVRQDIIAVFNRDAACQTFLEVVLFFKGFCSLVCHRVARQRWLYKKRSMMALFLQSQASAVFGVDIHPAATMGAGILLDHGTGVVIGETARVGDGCTILHQVTLGGTGKETGDRHPKVGEHVLVGAGAKILGNIVIGNGAKIGAGSVVLRSIPSGATAVGAPAKIIGRVKELDPASTVDEVLEGVSLLHKETKEGKVPRVDSSLSTATTVLSDYTSSSDDDGASPPASSSDCMCPFRELRKFGKNNAPPNSVTFCTLSKLLSPLGVSKIDIGEIYFAMDKDVVGYISMEYFVQHCVEVVQRFASNVSPSKVEEAMTLFLEKQNKKLVKEEEA